MPKTYSFPEEVSRVIGRALHGGGLGVDVHVDLLGNPSRALELITAVSRDEHRPIETINGGKRVWIKRFGVQYGICARGAGSTTAGTS